MHCLMTNHEVIYIAKFGIDYNALQSTICHHLLGEHLHISGCQYREYCWFDGKMKRYKD